MESTRQLKVARQIQKDMGEILLQQTPALFPGMLVSVTQVRVSPDLGFAKVFLSIFPFAKRDDVMDALNLNVKAIRHNLAQRVRSQLRIVPEIAFQVDDSLEYIEHIDNLLK